LWVHGHDQKLKQGRSKPRGGEKVRGVKTAKMERVLRGEKGFGRTKKNKKAGLVDG